MMIQCRPRGGNAEMNLSVWQPMLLACAMLFFMDITLQQVVWMPIYASEESQNFPIIYHLFRIVVRILEM